MNIKALLENSACYYVSMEHKIPTILQITKKLVNGDGQLTSTQIFLLLKNLN